MKIAALDIGTNTCLCLIAEVEDGKIQKVISDESRVIRLGQGMNANREFHPDALKRLDECLATFKEQIDKNAVDKTVAVATSAARDAKNKELFFQITEKHGIPTHVIAGQKEAELTFLGGTFDVDEKDNVAIVDVGGGSTELIFNDGEIRGESLDIGAVRLEESLVSDHPIPDKDLESVQLTIQKNMDDYRQRTLKDFKAKRLIAVAGTPTTLSMLMQEIDFEESKVHGYAITSNQFDQWITKMAAMTVEQRRELPGMQKGREDVIVCGCLILRASLDLFLVSELSVSTKGVRYGLALSAARGDF